MQGDAVTVFTSNALALDGFWSPEAECTAAGVAMEEGVEVRRYALWRMHGRRWLLKPLSLVPWPLWQCLTSPCNPIAFGMWRDAGCMPLGAFDAVHASAFPYAFPIACAWRLARSLMVPFYVTPFLHLGDPTDPNDRTRQGYTAPHLRWLLEQADGVFVQTSTEFAAVRSLGIAEEGIHLQGLGVDPAECTGGLHGEARIRWSLPEDAFVVGHLANNSFEKGTNDLLAAFELAAQRDPTIHLLLAGPAMPNFTRAWHEFTRRQPALALRVHRLGPLSDADKRDFFAAIDAFVLPSRSDSFGLVLLEAWANGVPNVAYRAGGVADIIRHERDGLLAQCGDLSALASAIERLARDVALRESLGRSGLARIASEFRWVPKLDLVREVIGGARKTRIEEASRTLPTLPASLRSE
jgi:glycosyltransferase involved in cell wall biosynthesis